MEDRGLRHMARDYGSMPDLGYKEAFLLESSSPFFSSDGTYNLDSYAMNSSCQRTLYTLRVASASVPMHGWTQVVTRLNSFWTHFGFGDIRQLHLDFASSIILCA